MFNGCYQIILEILLPKPGKTIMVFEVTNSVSMHLYFMITTKNYTGQQKTFQLGSFRLTNLNL